MLDPQKEESVLDLFAAPGGKCSYIAERMNNTGEVIAVDKIPSKMKLLKQAADRLQLTNIKTVITNAFKYGPVAPAFQRVLVDAPCSGWAFSAENLIYAGRFIRIFPSLSSCKKKLWIMQLILLLRTGFWFILHAQ